MQRLLACNAQSEYNTRAAIFSIEEQRMPRRKSKDPLKQAFFDAWIDEAEMPDGMRNRKIKAFRAKWGALDDGAFEQALQRGDEGDRLCALFALGYLAPAGGEQLLVPFLSSPVRKERWASAIGLGVSRDERALSFLHTCLLEQMEYVPSPSDREMDRMVAQARETRPESALSDILWDFMSDPVFVRLTEESQRYRSTYQWYTLHRLTITALLGEWGDSRAIPVLRLALENCWGIFQRGRIPGGSAPLWNRLEDDLAYALGQLEAWDALNDVKIPHGGLQLARMYLVLGYLNINPNAVYGGSIAHVLDKGVIDEESIAKTLQEKCGMNTYQVKRFFQEFKQSTLERGGLW
jgi:hypothetical protein